MLVEIVDDSRAIVGEHLWLLALFLLHRVRYADEEFSTFDEFVEASACDFMNLHNGLFTVNVSNDHEIELTLTPPVTVKGSTCEGFTEAIALPIQYTFGTVTFVITK